MRVLHLYAGNLYGGVERLLAALAAADRDAGMEATYALAFEGRAAEGIREAGGRVEVLGAVRMRRPWSAVAARGRLRALVDRERPEVAVCHSSWAHGIFAPVLRGAGVPLAFWLHDAARGSGWADRLARRTRPDLALCTSGFAASSLARLWAHLPARVVYPPVPPPGLHSFDRAALRAHLRTPPDDVVVLQASRMEPWKGHAVLLEALGRLRDRAGWSCWIAGGASRPHERRHEAGMRALAERLGIGDRVRFLGHRGDVAELMAAADVFCQPNLGAEPFGIAFVEAMHAGLPVVGSAVGGTLEIVDEGTGILTAPGDAAALAEALGSLIGDAGERAQLGGAGPARARALSDPAGQAARVRGALAGAVEGGGG